MRSNQLVTLIMVQEEDGHFDHMCRVGRSLTVHFKSDHEMTEAELSSIIVNPEILKYFKRRS